MREVSDENRKCSGHPKLDCFIAGGDNTGLVFPCSEVKALHQKAKLKRWKTEKVVSPSACCSFQPVVDGATLINTSVSLKMSWKRIVAMVAPYSALSCWRKKGGKLSQLQSPFHSPGCLGKNQWAGTGIWSPPPSPFPFFYLQLSSAPLQLQRNKRHTTSYVASFI